MDKLNNLVPRKNGILKPEEAAKLVELVEPVEPTRQEKRTAFVDDISRIYKLSSKKTFETLEEMADYTQKLFSDKKVMIEKRPEEGAEKDRTTLNGYISISDGSNECLLDCYYECPNCKFVLGIKKYEKFGDSRFSIGEGGSLKLCRICNYQFEKLITEHGL